MDSLEASSGRKINVFVTQWDKNDTFDDLMTKQNYSFFRAIGLSSKFDIKYNEESDEDYVSNREKDLLLRQFIGNEEE